MRGRSPEAHYCCSSGSDQLRCFSRVPRPKSDFSFPKRQPRIYSDFMIISPVFLLQSPVVHLTIRHTLPKDKPSLCSRLPALSTRRTVTVNPPLSLEYPAHPHNSTSHRAPSPKLFCSYDRFAQTLVSQAQASPYLVAPPGRLQSRPCAVLKNQDGFET